MKIYLDDDSADPVLANFLLKQGHDVELPIEVDMIGKPDPVHLTYCIGEGRVVLTKNYKDFEYLHNLVMKAQGHHPGILVVRQTTTRAGTSRLVGLPRRSKNCWRQEFRFRNSYHILNHWR